MTNDAAAPNILSSSNNGTHTFNNITIACVHAPTAGLFNLGSTTATVTVTNSTIAGLKSNDYLVRGTAAHTFTITGSDISNFQYPWYCTGAATYTINRNKIHGCTAAYVSTTGKLYMNNNLITGQSGVAIDTYNITGGNIENNTVVSNASRGFSIRGTCTIDNFKNNIVTNNADVGVYLFSSGVITSLSNNDVWTNTGSNYNIIGTANGSASGTTDLAGSNGNIAADPKYVSASDWHLKSTSPCINAGVNVGLTADYDGHTLGANLPIGAFGYWVGGTVAGTLAPITGAIAAAHGVGGTMAGTLPAITGSLAATYSSGAVVGASNGAKNLGLGLGL